MTKEENEEDKDLETLENVVEEETEETAETQTETEIEETPIKEETTEEIPDETGEEEEEALAPAEEEEIRPSRREKAEREEDIVEERIYTVPLGKAWIMPPNKRAPRAMRILKSFVTKHMKLEARRSRSIEEEEEEPSQLIISNEVNQKIWSRGIEKPPRKVRVRTTKDKEGNVNVHLAEGD